MPQIQEPAPKKTPSPTLKTKKDRPDKVLPTERINFNKQLDLLRAFAAAAGANGKAVGNKDAADIVKMKESTTSLANAFFLATGLLQRHPDGGFVPSEAVKRFALAYKWNPENAAHHLDPLIRATWFAQALLPKIEYSPLSEDDALTIRAQAASAEPMYRSQIGLLIDYLEVSGIVQRDGGFLKAGKAGPPPSQERQSTPGGLEMRDPLPSKVA